MFLRKLYAPLYLPSTVSQNYFQEGGGVGADSPRPPRGNLYEFGTRGRCGRKPLPPTGEADSISRPPPMTEDLVQLVGLTKKGRPARPAEQPLPRPNDRTANPPTPRRLDHANPLDKGLDVAIEANDILVEPIDAPFQLRDSFLHVGTP